MASEVERLAVLIEANTKAYENAMAKMATSTDRALRSAGAAIGRLDKSLTTVSRTAVRLAGILGVGLSVGGIKSMVDEVGNLADEADRLGVTTDALQALRFEMQKGGVEPELLSRAMAKFSAAAVEGADAGNTLGKVFRDNSVSMRQANGEFKTADQLLVDFAGLVANAGTHQEKLALAAEAFGGRAGPKMLAVLEAIANEGLPGIIQKGKEAGQVMDEELVRRADEMGDRWVAAVNRVQNALVTLVMKAADAGASIGQGFEKLLQKDREFFGVSPHYLLKTMGQKGDFSEFSGIDARIGASGKKPGARTNTGSLTKPSDEMKEGEREARRLAEQLQRVNDALQLEFDNLGRTNTEQRVYNELARAGVSAASAEGQAIAALVTQIENKKTAMETFNEATQFFGDSMMNALDGLILRGEKAEDVLKNMVMQIIRATLQANLMGQGPLAGLFGAANPAGGVGGIFGALFGGFRAGGGGVQSGKGYVVGEHGAEMFFPGKSGTITPSGGMGGGSPVFINIKNESGSKVEQSRRQAPGGGDIIDILIPKIYDRMQRDNVIGKTVESGYGQRPAPVRR